MNHFLDSLAACGCSLSTSPANRFQVVPGLQNKSSAEDVDAPVTFTTSKAFKAVNPALEHFGDGKDKKERPPAIQGKHINKMTSRK